LSTKNQPGIGLHSQVNQERSIRTHSNTLSQKLGVPQAEKVQKRLKKRLFGRSKKRVIRFSLLAANVIVLAVVVGFVVKSPSTGKVIRQNSSAIIGGGSEVSPLDELSSADIAVHVAKLAKLEETTSVVNYADTINTQLAITPADEKVVAKPQVVATATKSRKDIRQYTTVAGDTISAIATKFGVTSDSIRWSNTLTGNTVAAGKVLWISPISDGIVYEVKSGDTPDSLATRFRANKEQIIAFNDAEVSGLPVGQRVVIPNGSVQAAATTANYGFGGGFAWGGYTAIYSNNGYDYGWCTWWAAKRRADIGRPVPSNMGNACNWVRSAQLAGIPTGSTPANGAVIFTKSGCWGHVGFVEEVLPDGSAWVTDMNSHGQVSKTDSRPAGGWNRVSWRLVTPDQFGRFYFIY
jgi:surface antigen